MGTTGSSGLRTSAAGGGLLADRPVPQDIALEGGANATPATGAQAARSAQDLATTAVIDRINREARRTREGYLIIGPRQAAMIEALNNMRFSSSPVAAGGPGGAPAGRALTVRTRPAISRLGRAMEDQILIRGGITRGNLARYARQVRTSRSTVQAATRSILRDIGPAVAPGRGRVATLSRRPGDVGRVYVFGTGTPR